MGEKSKTIGEKGEKIVENFLKMIGWNNPQPNETIICQHPAEHKSKSSERPRATHGIDFFYANKSNLKINTLDNIVISVKYSAVEYPKYPSTMFKSHLTDLAQTLECFIRSELRQNSNSDFNELRSIKKADDLGVLFWINNNKTSTQNIAKDVATIEIPKDINFSSIYLVDNYRMAFIHQTLTKLNSKHSDFDINFHYNQSDANFSDSDIKKYGKSMPVEYLTADMIPFRLINRLNNEVIFCISLNDNFNEENLNYILSYASDVSLDFTTSFVILFPDYNELEHGVIGEKVIGKFNKREHKITVTIHSYTNGFWSLGDE
ncbi:hypothetical protein [Shewanella sp. S1-58-MNA-CIBAN-0166]|uniref:GapS4a family protein n=1 Tax=Shewanella sp. S1-58-MNA-CIBAN-0166 TaxID=3140467 RepID=UPI003325BF7D